MKFSLDKLMNKGRFRKMTKIEASRLRKGNVVFYNFGNLDITPVMVTSIKREGKSIVVHFYSKDEVNNFWFRDTSHGKEMCNLVVER